MEQNQQTARKEQALQGLEDLISLEPKGLDLSRYEGQRAKIEKVGIIEVSSKFARTGKERVLRVESEVMTTVKDKEGNERPVRASELFNLIEEDGQIGWSRNENAKLQKFMKKLKVDHPNELIGKEAIIGLREKEGSSTTFLGFVI